jgi:hypothetical protein
MENNHVFLEWNFCSIPRIPTLHANCDETMMTHTQTKSATRLENKTKDKKYMDIPARKTKECIYIILLYTFTLYS